MKPANTETFRHVTTLKMAAKDDFIELSLILVNATEPATSFGAFGGFSVMILLFI